MDSNRSVDVLSDMLKIVRLNGSIFWKASFGVPYAVASGGRKAVAPLLLPDAKHVTMFHMIAEGRCLLEMPGRDPVPMERGDLMLLPFGDRHVLRSGDGPVVDADTITAGIPAEGVNVVHYGQGVERTEVVCGFVQSGDLFFNSAFASLPPLLVEHTAAEPVTSLLANTVRNLIEQVSTLREGSQEMLGRLMEMLFVEMLRRYVSRLPPESAGWFGALNDPVVARALQVIHASPMEAWTVENLASRAGASRSVLADRFKATLGHPPMQYLANWRLQLATGMLRETRRSIADIAAEIGYESEAAFSRAFKRHIGQPPGAWREQAAGARA